MKLNMRVIALIMLGLMVGTGQIYAANQLDDVGMEFVEISAEQKQKLEDEIRQKEKLVAEYNNQLKAEAQKEADELARETELKMAKKEAEQVSKPVSLSSRASIDFRKDITQARDTEVWKKNNFLEMRIAFEDLTQTKVTSSGPNGMLYTTYGWDLAGDWQNEKTKDINYNWGVGSKYMDLLLANKEIQDELAKLSSTTFKDIKGDEWYAKHIVPAVYFGLINGYSDGTFKGNAPVSRAEFIVMGSNAHRNFRDASDVGFPERYKAHKDQWYYTSIEAMYGSPTGSFALTVNDMNADMTRGEVAVMLAGYFDKDFEKEYLSNNNSLFKDITKISNRLYEVSQEDRKSEYMKQLKTPNVACKEVVAALNVLKAKGVMVGDANGNSNWTKTVTRGEVIALFERCGHLYIK